MGKDKDSGRSKTRPSSSSLAASLLPLGASNVGFGGYLGSSRIETATVAEEASTTFTTTDPELAQHLKRLGRKDPTTKLKALTALCTLFREKSGEDIVNIVPQWAFEYKKLLNDYNREVRRATHETMTSLVTTIGRGLAPHLKSLIGPWWFSQFDQVSEISQAATRSFEAAFPAQEKRLEALVIFSNEIFIYLDENVKLIPQAVSDKATPMDELEDMHQHVLSSSLLALATLLDVLVGLRAQTHKSVDASSESKGVPKARVNALSSAEKMFCTHNYFLEFLKSKHSRVRSSTYSVLGSFVNHLPHTVNEQNFKMLSAGILGSLQEKDASCHSSMWDMILLFTKRFHECWTQGNIHKYSLTRLWGFLRNGCYGSQQTSYPVLVLLLDSLPVKIVVGEHFMLNFFQSLWAGRNPLDSNSTNRQVFFAAFKECFLWGLYKAPRYVPVEEVARFQVNLIDGIFVKLMWGDYFSLVGGNDQDGCSSKNSMGLSEDVNCNTQPRSMETLVNYPISYMHDLGKCIIELLSEMPSERSTLLRVFQSTFQKGCLEVFQLGNHLTKFPEYVERIASFFLLLDELAVQKDQSWPLDYLAGPLMAKLLPSIKSLDSIDVVRFLCTMIKIFGPRIIILDHFMLDKGESCCNFAVECRQESCTVCFLQVFKDDFIPWCLHGLSCSSSLKLDLLIGLFDDELFREQWHSVIVYSTKTLKYSGDETWRPDADHVTLLTMLMEKVKKKIGSKKIQVDSKSENGSQAEHWQHSSLDMAVVSVACHSSSTCMPHAHFINSSIGGSSEHDQICFLSNEALVPIYEAVLRNLTKILATSSYKWATVASSSLLSAACQTLNKENDLSETKMFEMAWFSVEILEGTLYRSRKLDKDAKLLPCILAAIFFIKWVESLAVEDDHVDGCSESSEYMTSDSNFESVIRVVAVGSQDHVDTRLSLGKKAHAFHRKISFDFWRGLDPCILLSLRHILIQTARSAIFEMCTIPSDRIPALCCNWVLDLLQHIYWNSADEQFALDKLLSEYEYWPIWVSPHCSTGTRSADVTFQTLHVDSNESKHYQFVAFVDKLISNLGVSKVIAGFIPESYSSCNTGASQYELSSSCYSRAWLAAELLCTWDWQGGCALESLLPLLSEYIKNTPSSTTESLLYSVVNILLDGAISHGADSHLTFFNVWTASHDEVKSIQDPYLRALISLLFVLIVKEPIWKRYEVIWLFKNVVDKLFVCTNINRSCLRVLPFVLNIIRRPLLVKNAKSEEASEVPEIDSSNVDSVCGYIVSWLHTALSLPSLAFDQKQTQDLEQWIEVIISCYPLSTTGGVGSFEVSELGDISHLERTLLLKLFRKQRGDDDASITSNKISPTAFCNQEIFSSLSVQILVAKLTAVSVGYCWKEFNDDDWDFVLVQLRRWIGSSVLVMEEIAEKADDAVTNFSAHTVIEKLKLAIEDVDSLPFNISRIALIILSLFSRLFDSNEIEDTRVLHDLTLEKWACHKNGILEEVIRLFFATGAAEAIARSFNEEASFIITASRHVHCNLWCLVATCVINAPPMIRNSAVQSVDLWGLSVGPITALYALLFSYDPIQSLQLAAYTFLSTESICMLSILKEEKSDVFYRDSGTDHTSQTSFEESINLRDEISSIIQMPSAELLELDLLSAHRVNYFIAWALILSYLQALQSSSSARERLTQYVHDSVSSLILDCIFQHIPLKLGSSQNLKKKDVELPVEFSKAANSAKHAITTCSLSFAVEFLWPVGTEQMAILAGSMYGSMIHLLPAYVRNWYTSLRDRSLASAIESFTKIWCSSLLIADEFSQMKGVGIADENFSISVNKSAYEIIATYKKEETGMDLVIHLPTCYPLRLVDVDCTRSLGISEVKQRKWLLSLTAFVRNQNGAIAEAVRTWKSNFDKEFQGVEECPICYSIIHPSNHSLPRLACKTCKHKFHSACLYKWFSTSNKSTCPLCQMPF